MLLHMGPSHSLREVPPQTLPWYLLAGSSHTVSVKLPPPVNESLDRAVTSLLVMAR